MTRPAPYDVPAEVSRQETVIQRSRFITTLAPVASVDAARDFVARIGAEFPDATHHCYAYVVGPPGSLAQAGMSDAGEPHGTAGRPMLEVLLHSGVGDVAAVVTRYFGGVKLGKGGLARAYAGCVKSALAEAQLVRKVTWARLRLEVDYPALEAVRRLGAALGVEVLAEEFGARVKQVVRLPEEHAERFLAALRDSSGGTATVERLD
ncbi:MAG: YigZ family protein [Planctomycetes bacterium]|nr:YigZ family protein [Planctomycetota bacterium]